jgi:hypothetical protein
LVSSAWCAILRRRRSARWSGDFARAGNRAAAVALYRAAAEKTTSVSERKDLMMRAARLSVMI